VVPLPREQAPGVAAGGRFSGRWRYNRAAGRGVALRYDRGLGGALAGRAQDVHAGGRFSGRWRYDRAAGRGVALCYDRGVSRAPAPTSAPPQAPPTLSPVVRVLCYCGDFFTFAGEGGICPSCGQPAEWPTMGQLEREMRTDLEELLRAHEEGADPD
jgi:hypothetical protein